MGTQNVLSPPDHGGSVRQAGEEPGVYIRAHHHWEAPLQTAQDTSKGEIHVDINFDLKLNITLNYSMAH